MIRLALARYQPNSLAGVELGRVVLADVMTLDPERSVTVTLNSKKKTYDIVLSGPSYTAASNTGNQVGAYNLIPGVAQVLLQTVDGAIPDPVLGWDTPSPTYETVMTPDPVPRSGPQIWRLSVPIPSPKPKSGTVRLLITQYELFQMDGRPESNTPNTTKGWTFQDGAQQETIFGPLVLPGFRIVHQDIVPITF
jgi:hypothetical protein